MKRAGERYRHFRVLRAECGQLQVVLGCAPARDLYALSFADVLDEEKELGYQRPFDHKHAREFRRYIEEPQATTIPLTFNLRGDNGDGWKLSGSRAAGTAELSIRIPTASKPPVLAQVDCQHCLGMMGDCVTPLTFQCYLGLSTREEMAIFSVINAKAKGLSSSLLDFHTTKLVPSLEHVQLELYVAKSLNDDPDSPWLGKVKLGGVATQGSQRRISLRGLQAATKQLLQRCALLTAPHFTPVQKYEIVKAFWTAVAKTWPKAWSLPRRYLLLKGVGVTALSLLAAEIVPVALSQGQVLNEETFTRYLIALKSVDWSNTGPFRAFGGRHGANEVHQELVSRLFAPSLANLQAQA
jgi:DNA sulfur modification protein DndB